MPFGAVLAMVLSLATVSYAVCVAFWHGSDRNFCGLKVPLLSVPNGMWCLWSQRFGDGELRITEYPTSIRASWAGTRLCGTCEKRHGRRDVDCSGKSVASNSTKPMTSSIHAGPISFSRYASNTASAYGVTFPPWLPVPVLAAYPALYFLIVGIRRFRRRPGHCLHCDYDLTGNESGVCPECGTKIAEEPPDQGVTKPD